MRVAQFILFPLLFASDLALAESKLNLSPGVTPISHAIYDLHMTILWICVAIGIIVFGSMFYSILHYRHAKGAKAARFHEHLWLEITWTLIPLLILIVMAIPATHVLREMGDNSQADLTIKITGYQWKWRYDYLDQGINFFSNNATPYQQMQNTAPKDLSYLKTVDHPLVVPIHKKIRLLFTSNDVIHAWFVPALGVQRDAIPGFITESWTRIDRAGIYYGQCNKLCGVNHAFMPIVVVAMSEKDFANWMIQQKGGEVPVTPAPAAPNTTAAAPVKTATPAPATKLALPELMKRGEQIYLNTCAVCHQPTGLGMPPTFPALKGSKIATGAVAAHIHIVMNGKPGTAMQAFKDQLSDEDIAAVITYERHSFGNNMSDVIQPEDIKSARTKQ